jgi:NAD-dependent SIR2 family protein deacetylase
MKDMIVVCVQCEEEFEFSAMEQKRYEDRGYDFPKRCPSCRKHKYRNMDLMEDRHHVNRKRDFSSKYRNEEW